MQFPLNGSVAFGGGDLPAVYSVSCIGESHYPSQLRRIRPDATLRPNGLDLRQHAPGYVFRRELAAITTSYIR